MPTVASLLMADRLCASATVAPPLRGENDEQAGSQILSWRLTDHAVSAASEQQRLS
jgi:hypothetical protein